MGEAKPVDKANRTDVISVEQITNSILVFRGHKVLLDAELATLYGVTTGRLNEAVKRNLERFPRDFMFQLSAAEHAALISQIATSKPGRGGRRKLPWVFTEHGAIQAANVLNSPRAVERAYSAPAVLQQYSSASAFASSLTCATMLGIGIRFVPADRTSVSSTSTYTTRRRLELMGRSVGFE